MANNLAFTLPINPPGATPLLTRRQIWAGLLLKIRSAETFIPNAILSTTVISESLDAGTQNQVTVRDVVFRDGGRKVRETVTAYEDCRVDFVMEDGSRVENIVAEGEGGGLSLTYVFEWRHPGVEGRELEALREKERVMGRKGVEGTIEVLRELARAGKLGDGSVV